MYYICLGYTVNVIIYLLCGICKEYKGMPGIIKYTLSMLFWLKEDQTLIETL